MLSVFMVILIMLLSISSIRIFSDYSKAQTAIYKVYVLVLSEEYLVVNLDDAETGQRGYVITNDPIYLTPYNLAVKQIPTLVDSLTKQMTIPEQIARFDQVKVLVNDKLAEMASALDIYKQNGQAAAFAQVSTNRGSADMIQIRTILTTMTNYTLSRLTTRSHALANDRTKAAILAVIVIAVIVLLMTALVWLLVQSKIRDNKLMISERRLQEANDALHVKNGEVQAAVDYQREFVGAASHELRTPITVIMGYIELAMEGPITEAQTNLEIIFRASRRLKVLVDDLLTVNALDNKGVELHRVSVDIRNIIEPILEAFQPVADSRSILLECEADETVPLVNVDISRIEQCVSNLISNALKFTHAGSVTVKTRIDQTNLDYVYIDIIDTGEGISPKDNVRLFQRFFRSESARKRSIPGTGLGLVIVKGIVEAHGGRITVRSKEGEGSTFTMALPTSDLTKGTDSKVTAYEATNEARDWVPSYPSRVTE